jgi:hypothetical protein
MCFSCRRPALAWRGGSRSSRTLSAGCDGRVGSQRGCRGRTIPARTAKSCGPDTPTLVSSERELISLATGARKPGPWGEREGHPAASFSCCWRAMGEAVARHSLRPLLISEGGSPHRSGALCAARMRIHASLLSDIRIGSARDARGQSHVIG